MDKITLDAVAEATEAAKHDPIGGSAAYGVGLKAYEALSAVSDRLDAIEARLDGLESAGAAPAAKKTTAKA